MSLPALVLSCLLAAASAGNANQGYGPDCDEACDAYRRIHTGLFDLELNTPPSAALVELGRVLFFEPRLSSTRRMSCATCHNPDKAWADGRRRALGRVNELRRNTPSLYNASRNLAVNFFWDGRADRLEDAILEAMTSRAEMNLDQAALDRLAGLPGYRRLIDEAFPKARMTPERAAAAIAAFVRADIAVGPTPFDRFKEDPSALDPAQKRGLVLFVGKARCLQCHSGPFLSDDSYHRNGLRPDPGNDDPGRYAVESEPTLWRAFKTPPLRNVALTAPYMHDGRLSTLQEVVDFYDRGGDDPDPDPAIKRLHLSQEEKADLVAFLNSLSGPQRAVARPSLPAER